MRSGLSRLSICFAGGCAGAVVNSLAVWGAGELQLTSRMGVRLAPAFTYEWLLPRVLWGGLWGLLFLLPLMTRRNILLRGLVVSLAPTLAQLFYFFPQAGRGMMGLSFGQLTPLFVLLANAVWGITAAWWIRQSGVH
jgi:hypothetical protein